jgi:hypothetical protein
MKGGEEIRYLVKESAHLYRAAEEARAKQANEKQADVEHVTDTMDYDPESANFHKRKKRKK